MQLLCYYFKIMSQQENQPKKLNFSRQPNNLNYRRRKNQKISGIFISDLMNFLKYQNKIEERSVAGFNDFVHWQENLFICIFKLLIIFKRLIH